MLALLLPVFREKNCSTSACFLYFNFLKMLKINIMSQLGFPRKKLICRESVLINFVYLSCVLAFFNSLVNIGDTIPSYIIPCCVIPLQPRIF